VENIREAIEFYIETDDKIAIEYKQIAEVMV